MHYHVKTENISLEAFAEMFQAFSLRYEEDHYTECGFEQATKRKERLLKSIRAGQLTQQDVDEVHPVFVYSNSDVYQFLAVSGKKSGFLRGLFKST
ncbi:hypothetical protein KZO25_13895 [Halomonas sp. ANAO-440]|uniref:hypothetical protein n=1 Tax=Halomonas sp. ANAO-440 TaxID=2861360 RepID=UPI001CAA613A|nr:hypothetical protein [Halomonas sp. ANAO-440]MBZ0331405.1 hypothetical protein [Halomonas sp. ANAO-440]